MLTLTLILNLTVILNLTLILTLKFNTEGVWADILAQFLYLKRSFIAIFSKLHHSEVWWIFSTYF